MTGQGASITTNKDSAVVKVAGSAADVTAGPAGVGLEGVASPKEWTGAEPSAREVNPAVRLIDRVFKEPATVRGADIHKLLEYGRDPELSDSVAAAIERAVSKNSSLAEDVVTACHARLAVSSEQSSPVRGVVIRALTAAVVATPERSHHRAKVMKGIDSIDLTPSERLEVEKGGRNVTHESLKEIRQMLPLPKWYHRAFGEREKTVAERAHLIEQKHDVLCALAEQGELLDEVLSLLVYSPSVAQDVLQSLRRHVTEGSTSLPDTAQKTLWNLVVSDRLSFTSKLFVEEILLAGAVCEDVQRSLAKRLQELKDTTSVINLGDRFVVRLSSQIYQRAECIETLSDMLVSAKNSWPLGIALTGTDVFLMGEPYRREKIVLRDLLGKNFLGAEEWFAQNIDVGTPPPIPSSITTELLESECPLHPGEKIKDTHVLMLVPKTVNGKPYTALELDKLCATRKGSGKRLIDSDYTSWKSQGWAKAAQVASEWVLIPKRDPDPKVSPDKHFRGKNIAAQKGVHDSHYKEYREVKTLELMTMAVLYNLTHKERLLYDCYLRCEEPNASGGRVCVGNFIALGLKVSGNGDVNDSDVISRALAREIKT